MVVLNTYIKKRKKGLTPTILELKSLCKIYDWNEVEDYILILNDEYVNVLRIFVLNGCNIKNAIKMVEDVCKYSLQLNISTVEISKIISSIINKFGVYFCG